MPLACSHAWTEPTTCPRCRSERIARDRGEARAFERDQRLASLKHSWWRSCNGGLDGPGPDARTLTRFPEMPYAHFTNSAWRAKVHPKLLNVIELWDGKQSMLVLGPTGVGKTSAVVARLHADQERLERQVGEGATLKHRFAYVTGPELSGCRRRAKIGAEARLVEHACDAPICFIDEVGYEPQSEEVMFVVDHRYRAGTPTIVISGLDRDAFVARYGGALARRVTEGGLFVDLYRPAKGAVRSVG